MNYSSKLYDDKMKSFFCDLFINTGEIDEKDFNLYLDILTEKTKSLVYSTKTLKKKDNWETIKKAKFPGKISKSLRYLVSINDDTKSQFIQYIDSHFQHNFSNNIISKINNDLKNKIEKIEKLYLDCHQNFEIFQDKFKDLIFNRSFKLQWPFWEIKEAMSFCKEDLSNPKLKLEFERIKEKHYSYLKSN